MDSNQRKIANIHDFSLDFDSMADHLDSLKEKYSSGLIIPIKDKDIDSPGLPKMIEEINKCHYLTKVLIALSANTRNDYDKLLKLRESFKTQCDIVWCNKAEVLAVLQDLKEKGLDLTSLSGKGKDVWITIGIASLDLFAFVLHDSDILSYNKMLPTKLLYPIIEPKLDFFFSKGYYARISLENRKLYGFLRA